MKEKCSDYWERIVNLAEGGQDEIANRHVAGCVSCARKLQELRQILTVGKTPTFDAPLSLVATVKDMLPIGSSSRATLLRSTLAWSGARTVTEDFQLVVAVGKEQVRLMYLPLDSGWQVLGRLPSMDWSALKEGARVQGDSAGRFSFIASNLAQTDFKLAGPTGEVVVPSAQEMLDGSEHTS
jgi:hypothetical protein